MPTDLLEPTELDEGSSSLSGEPGDSGPLIPSPGESQPDFAIRFHESMSDRIPNTDQRNSACFSIWREHNGEEPEVGLARSSYTNEEFDERRDIPIFEEHETPRGDKYDRGSLVSLIRSVNHRISDSSNFAPISSGHTSDDPSAPEPEVLGYAGTARLGMVGNRNPRWAIFHDEYHRKEKSQELRNRRGRSVEVWRYPQMEDRFFHPVAALGAETPRLNIPPARYARYSRRDNSGEEIEVDLYMMPAVAGMFGGGMFGGASPGGSNTFVPGGNFSDQHRDRYDSEMPDSTLINNIMEALSNTAVWQYVIQMMERDGMSGSPAPVVSQPPQLDMNQPEGMGDVTSPGLPPQSGQPPAQQMPHMSGPYGDTSQQPVNPYSQGRNRQMTQPTQYARSSVVEEFNARIEKLEAEKDELRKELAEERSHRIFSDRFGRLKGMSQRFDLDLEFESERAKKASDEQFEEQCKSIERYRRLEETVPDYSAISGAGHQNSPEKKSSRTSSDELGAEEAVEVRKYCERHNLDYVEGREKYIADRNLRESSASVAG